MSSNDYGAQAVWRDDSIYHFLPDSYVLEIGINISSKY